MQDKEEVFWAPEHGCAVIRHEAPLISHSVNMHVLCLDGLVSQTHRYVSADWLAGLCNFERL